MSDTYISPILENFINLLSIDYSSFILTYFILWFFVLYIVARANKNRKHNKVVVTEYEPLTDISAVLARYVLTGGMSGGMKGDISENGLQRIALIDLYEFGGLKELIFVDDEIIEYEIDENYQGKKLKEEQLLFVSLLEKHVGKRASIEHVDKEDSFKGFTGIDTFWYEYWNIELQKICVERGYFDKKEIKWNILLWYCIFSMTFGVFFSFFVSLIPIIGLFIALFLLLPIILVFLFSAISVNGISYLLGSYRIPFELLPGPILVLIFMVLPFITWVIWIMIFGQNQSMALNSTTQKGKDIIREINGYKEFAKKVDQDRLSFSLNRDLDFERNKTSFSWLAIFGLIKNRHWDEFYKVHSRENISRR